MKNPPQEISVDNALIAGIEDALDSANLLSLDLAIHAFANDEDPRAVCSSAAEAFKCAVRRGLNATDAIGRMMADMRKY